MMLLSLASTLVLSLVLGSAQASKDSSYYNANSGNPNVDLKMYWSDAENVLEDLSKFSALYVEFHSCVWSWKNYGSQEDDDIDENDYWYMGSVPPMGANVAFSLYGSLKGNSFAGCNSDTFINSFYTSSGFESFVTAMKYAGVSGFSSYAGSSSYTSDCQGGYGIGCDYTNGFAVHKYSSNECDPQNAKSVKDTLSGLNSAMQKATCVKIYDRSSYSGSTSGTAVGLLSDSKACNYMNMMSPDGDCPDPHGKVSFYISNYNKGIKSSRPDPFAAYNQRLSQAKDNTKRGAYFVAAAFAVLLVNFLIPKCPKRSKRGSKRNFRDSLLFNNALRAAKEDCQTDAPYCLSDDDVAGVMSASDDEDVYIIHHTIETQDSNMPKSLSECEVLESEVGPQATKTFDSARANNGTQQEDISSDYVRFQTTAEDMIAVAMNTAINTITSVVEAAPSDEVGHKVDAAVDPIVGARDVSLGELSRADSKSQDGAPMDELDELVQQKIEENRVEEETEDKVENQEEETEGELVKTSDDVASSVATSEDLMARVMNATPSDDASSMPEDSPSQEAPVVEDEREEEESPSPEESMPEESPEENEAVESQPSSDDDIVPVPSGAISPEEMVARIMSSATSDSSTTPEDNAPSHEEPEVEEGKTEEESPQPEEPKPDEEPQDEEPQDEEPQDEESPEEEEEVVETSPSEDLLANVAVSPTALMERFMNGATSDESSIPDESPSQEEPVAEEEAAAEVTSPEEHSMGVAQLSSDSDLHGAVSPEQLMEWFMNPTATSTSSIPVDSPSHEEQPKEEEKKVEETLEETPEEASEAEQVEEEVETSDDSKRPTPEELVARILRTPTSGDSEAASALAEETSPPVEEEAADGQEKLSAEQLAQMILNAADSESSAVLDEIASQVLSGAEASPEIPASMAAEELAARIREGSQQE